MKHSVKNPSQRYLGLELGGAKNPKTTLASIEFYPKERKTFLLDIFEKIGPDTDKSGDQVLLEIIEESRSNAKCLAVNVPLELPPCIGCKRPACARSQGCESADARYARQLLRKAEKLSARDDLPRLKEYTAYTQRPVEVWLRYFVLSRVGGRFQFELDETLGGNRAPLTARMHFLKKHLKKLDFVEVLPKLTVTLLAQQLGLPKRLLENYRNLESGAHSRSEIIDLFSEHFGIFIYERDAKKLAENLGSFDAFVSAYTAVLWDLGQCEPPPKGFPVESGWIAYPK